MTERTDQRWEMAHDALARRLPDGFIVLTPELDDPRVVRGPAAALWDLLDDRPTLDDIVADLARRFDAPPDQIRTDIADLWNELVRVRAVTPVPG